MVSVEALATVIVIEVCEKAGIKVVRTEFQHNELSDRGSDRVKASIQAQVHQFLDEDDGPSGPFRC
jgi:hypothetical protein